MISEKRRRHIEKLANLSRGKKRSEEIKNKISKARLKNSEKRINEIGTKFCITCGKKIIRTVYDSGLMQGIKVYAKRKYCSLYCSRHSKEFIERMKHQKNKFHPQWKGGRIVNKRGYIYIYSPNHPNKNSHGYVREHRLVMEKHLGRYLKKNEIVHHIDHNPSNNKLSNLMVFDNCGYHLSYHLKEKNV